MLLEVVVKVSLEVVVDYGVIILLIVLDSMCILEVYFWLMVCKCLIVIKLCGFVLKLCVICMISGVSFLIFFVDIWISLRYEDKNKYEKIFKNNCFVCFCYC